MPAGQEALQPPPPPTSSAVGVCPSLSIPSTFFYIRSALSPSPPSQPGRDMTRSKKTNKHPPRPTALDQGHLPIIIASTAIALYNCPPARHHISQERTRRYTTEPRERAAAAAATAAAAKKLWSDPAVRPTATKTKHHRVGTVANSRCQQRGSHSLATPTQPPAGHGRLGRHMVRAGPVHSTRVVLDMPATTTAVRQQTANLRQVRQGRLPLSRLRARQALCMGRARQANQQEGCGRHGCRRRGCQGRQGCRERIVVRIRVLVPQLRRAGAGKKAISPATAATESFRAAHRHRHDRHADPGALAMPSHRARVRRPRRQNQGIYRVL